MSLTTNDLQQIKEIVVGATAHLATNDDLQGFATKDDLKRFATKSDLDRFATKSDLDRFATKSDLDRFATKFDLDRMETRLTTSLSLIERDTFTRLDQHEQRITKLEQARAAA